MRMSRLIDVSVFGYKESGLDDGTYPNLTLRIGFESEFGDDTLRVRN